MTEDEQSLARLRAAIASASKVAKLNPGDDQFKVNVRTLRSEYAEKMLANRIKKVVATAPPLTPEQRDRLATLLRPEESA